MHGLGSLDEIANAADPRISTSSGGVAAWVVEPTRKPSSPRTRGG
jgi:hypothetical protein